MNKSLLLIPSFIFFAACGGPAGPWVKGGDIARQTADIMKRAQAIDEDVESERIKVVPAPACEAGHETDPAIEGTLALNDNGRIDRYTLFYGGEDSTQQASYYYDAEARLRYTLKTLRASNGTDLTIHVFFDQEGAVLDRRETLKEGPGYTEVFPDKIEDPKQHAASLCE